MQKDQLSSHEENYLKNIYLLSEKGKKTVYTSQLAEVLKIQPGSITDMIQKLAKKTLIKYQKYKGISLLQGGIQKALEILRKERLWNCFLMVKLNMPLKDIYPIAKQLAHIQSDKLVENLDQFLGKPTHDPYGESIPNAAGELRLKNQYQLAELQVGEKGTIVEIYNQTEDFKQYLSKRNIQLGSRVHIIEKISFDNSVDIVLNEQTKINLSKIISNQLILVK